MTLLLGGFLAALVLEWLLFAVRRLWQAKPFRVTIAGASVLLYAFAATGLAYTEFSVAALVFLLLTVYRIFNLLRVAEWRTNETYLYKAARRTSFVLLLGQLVCVFVWIADQQLQPGSTFWLSFLLGAQFAVAATVCVSTIRTLRRTKAKNIEPLGAHSNDLPTVTVAIPARNETEELEKCLYELVKSDYQKLEILVLDDCSQTKRTPAIIRDFAHAGVRFLKGTEPPEGWTAKNHAYAQLAAQANGELILFCGVDVRFEPHTIRQLVTTLKSRDKRMLSVLPLRRNRGIERSLVQAARYMWELTPLRRQFKRPPVLSTCWLIYREDLKRHGGLAAVKRAITPEAHFARQAIADHDSYSFIRATEALGITTGKTHAAQRSTALRVRYPSLHRRPEMVALVSLAETFFILATFVFAGLALFGLLEAAFTWLALVSVALLTVTYVSVAVSTRVNSWLVALFWPVPVTVSDLVTMHHSMWLYEFSEVIWKGRNVCVPVMQTYTRLPSSANESSAAATVDLEKLP